MNANFPSLPELQSLLMTLVADALRIDPCGVQLDRPFLQYGLDSIAALTIAGDLEDALRVTLPSTLLWDCPTVATLAAYLHGMVGVARMAVA